jgi:hypothetical protein
MRSEDGSPRETLSRSDKNLREEERILEDTEAVNKIRKGQAKRL